MSKAHSSRRIFLQQLAAGTAVAATGLGLSGCGGEGDDPSVS
ncbi:MAG TPA: twin-arginine translocation signal domain-containing protein, partial [Chromatiales bacterium]|nr:twin-arginine translocation signal domain-containing protein [Chromatiales bacterium]